MKITKHDIPVSEIIAKFTDDGESAGGGLLIR